LWQNYENEGRNNIVKFTLSFPNDNFSSLLLMVSDGSILRSETCINDIVKVGRRGALQFLEFVKQAFKEKYEVLTNK
jgi:hypothetical protein